MWRQICARSTPCLRVLKHGNTYRPFLGRSYFLRPYFPSSQSPFRFLEKQIRELEQHFDKAFGPSHGWYTRCSTLGNLDNLYNPIVEEEGVKKFLLEFDVRRFKPEEIAVKTSENDRTLTIEAKHKGDDDHYEFCQTLSLPKGVVAKDVTCRFTSEGILQIKAPYNPPVEEEKPKDTEIHVKHE